jgi:hypothetical protein
MNKEVFPIEHDSLHLSFADVVVDRHRAICAEDLQRVPLVQSIADRFGRWPIVIDLEVRAS